MSMLSPQMRELFRKYLLDTASARERERVERLIADDSELRAALDEEREALAVLDALPAHAPSRDLASAVERAMSQADAVEAKRAPAWKAAVPYVAAAAVVIIVLAMLPILSASREAARRATSENNLKQLGLIMKMYASESRGGKYPPLAPYDGVWMVDLRYLYPEFVSDLSLFVDPQNPRADEIRERMNELVAEEPVDWEAVTRLAAQSYVYPGWMIRDAEELPDFVRGVRQLAKADYGDDIRVGDKTFMRHREGIERFLITDINNPAGSAQAQSEIPIMFERVFRDDGGQEINVLYMDGRVESLPLGSKFPAVEAVAEAFPAPATE